MSAPGSRAGATVAGFGLVALVGVLDYLTGYEISFSIFYLIPIFVVGWSAGRTAGALVALASALAWLLVDLRSDHAYSNPVIPYWNAAVRLAFFLAVVHLLSAQKRLQEEQEAIAVQLQEAQKELDALTGLLPMCVVCKGIRDDAGYWKEIEVYLRHHSEADVSHSICPECARRLYPDLVD